MKRSKMVLAISLAMVLSILAIAMPVAPVMAATGNLSVTPASGPPGTTVTISGGGFTAGNTYTVSFEVWNASSETKVPTGVASGQVGSDGTFVTYYTIPSQPDGTSLPKTALTYNFTATTTGAGGNDTSNSQPFSMVPALSFSTSAGKVGDQINVGGRGFEANSTVNLYFDNNMINLPTTDNSGTFSFAFQVPGGAQGTHTIHASDQITASPNYNFTINPKLTVNETSTTPGSTITASGSGFTANSTITFSLDGVTIGNVANTDNLGSFSNAQLTVPVIAGGSHILKATDGSGYSDSTTITTSQALNINPASGAANTEIKITGGGFLANKTINVTYNGNSITTNPSIITSDASGNFSATINSPETAAGTYNITVSDGTNTSTAQFTLTASAKIDQTTGAVGASVPFSGNGFNANTTVTIQYDGVGIATAKSDASGSFSGTFTIPPGTAGQHKITITDGVNTISSNFTTTAAAQIRGPEGSGAQTSGYVGSDVTVTGSAFVPGATLTVTYDSTPVATSKVNGDGTFTTSFKVPVSKSGNHTVIASDGTNKISLSFMMDSTPPLAPALISPAKNANVQALANFQWSSVTDPSGVTYTLQVASDPGFNSIVVEKSGLTTNSYQLTQQEQLNSTGSNKPYYWRVKAIDLASNSSPWSTALTFTVGFQFPSWLLYFLIAVGAVVVFAAGFLFGKRSARYG